MDLNKNNKELTEELTQENTSEGKIYDGDLDSRIMQKRSFAEAAKEYLSSRRFKHGGLATAIIAFFIIGVIILNIVSVMLVDRIPALSPDMTADGIYTLSDTTKELLDSVDRDITIDILATEYDCKNPSTGIDPYATIPQALELINRYAQYSEHIEINFIDLASTPGYVNNYPEYSDSLAQYSVVISSDLRSSVTSFYDMLPYLGTNTEVSAQGTASYVETEICSKIKTVTLESVPVIAFLQSSGSEDPTGLQIKLASNGYEVKLVDFTSEEIPEDADAIVLSGLKHDLTDAQVSKISTYLLNNEQLSKNLFVFLDPTSPSTPVLDSLLAEWGIEVTRDVIYETDSKRYMTADYPFYFMANYIDDGAYSEGLEDRGLYFYNYASLDVKVLFEQRGNYTVTPLIGSSTTGITCPADQNYNPTQVDLSNCNQYYAMVESTLIRTTDENEQLSSSIYVSGSTQNIATELLGSDAIGNNSFFTNIFNHIAGITEQTVDVTPKYLSSIDFEISSGTANIISSIFQYIIPVGLFIIGIVVYLRRRHL